MSRSPHQLRPPSPLGSPGCYLSLSAGAAGVDVGRVQHIRAQVEVCVDAPGALHILDADLGVWREGVGVHVGALHLPAFGIPEVKQVKQQKKKFSKYSCFLPDLPPWPLMALNI